MSTDKINLAIQKIEAQLLELKSITDTGHIDEVKERVDRWFNRTRKVIDDYISNVEAENFKPFKQVKIYADAYDMLTDKIDSYQRKLKVILAELKTHPDTLIDPSKLEVRGDGLTKNDPLLKLLHPKILMVSQEEFEDGYYANSVFSAFKQINNTVKAHYKTTHKEELDGRNLMMRAMADASPSIAFGDLTTETGRNMQEGYRFIFAGSIQAIRNPKAHDMIKIDKVRALHFLFLASLQMYKLDEALERT